MKNSNLFTLTLALFVTLFHACQSADAPKDKDKVYINIANKSINYNADTIQYYIVNKTDNEIKLWCNADFFKREKDSLILDTWFNPQLKIYDENKEEIAPAVLSVYFKVPILDSLAKISKHYIALEHRQPDSYHLGLMHRYTIKIKPHDSILLSTKVNFENEPRFYDDSEVEGYILKNNQKYRLSLALNTNQNEEVVNYMKQSKVYSQPIYSDTISLKFRKTIYSK